MLRVNRLAAGLGLAAVLSTGAAYAAEPESCKPVRFADVGWTDIQATTGIASVLLGALGYEPQVIQHHRAQIEDEIPHLLKRRRGRAL